MARPKRSKLSNAADFDDRTFTWDNDTKSKCDGCPHEDTKEMCLISGLRDVRATVTFVLSYPTRGEIDVWTNGEQVPFPGRGREMKVFNAVRKRALFDLKYPPPTANTQMPLLVPHGAYNVVYLTGHSRTGSPSAAALRTCSDYMLRKLRAHRKHFDSYYPFDERTHVLVPMGAPATAAVLGTGSKLKFKEVRGLATPTQLAGYDWQVVPTESLQKLMMQPGIMHILASDIAKAYQTSYSDLKPETLTYEELMELYSFPSNNEELLAATEMILNYTGSEDRTPEQWAISLDTETNSLSMYDPDAKVLMASVGWDDRAATAIFLDHDEMPYDKDLARECIERICASPKPKIFHNWKFDFGALELCENIPVNNVVYDTMLGAHFLHEEMKGYFGLDAIVAQYLPVYKGYKNMIDIGLEEDLRKQALAQVEHDEPDWSKSPHLMPFFFGYNYEPASEGLEAPLYMDDDDLAKLWRCELAYLEAEVAGTQKAKSSARGKVRRLCKKYGVTVPDTVKKRDWAAEIEANGYEHIPARVLLAYAAADADVTRQIGVQQRLAAHAEGTLKPLMRLMQDPILPASRCLGSAQFIGTQIDVERLDKYEEEISEFRDKHLAALREMAADHSFNPASPDQLDHFLRNICKAPVTEFVFTDTDQLSVRKDWLKDMEETYTGDEEFELFARAAHHLRRWRGADKAVGTFIKGLRNLLDHEGRIHTQFKQNGTATGRLASARINLQNIPKYMCAFGKKGEAGYNAGWNIKQLFIPDEGQVFWQLDIKAAEIRVLCAYSSDPELTDALNQGLDIHSFTTAQVFDLDYEMVEREREVNPEINLMRTAIKRVVFGTLYGAGDTKVAEQIYGALSSDPAEEAKQIEYAKQTRLRLFARFPRVRNYIDSTKGEARRDHVVKTYFGRRRRFPLAPLERSVMSQAERQAVNFKIQSTASDILISQLNELFGKLSDIGATFQLTVHDSLCGSVPMSMVPKMGAFFDHYIVDRVREKFDWLPVPFAYDLEIGPDYGRPVGWESFMYKKDEDLNPKEKYVIGLLEAQFGPRTVVDDPRDLL